MGAVRSAVGRVVGLFVSDWPQTMAIVVILTAAYLVSRVLGTRGPWVGYGLAVALAAQLVISTLAEHRRRG
jgi:hypothetical protein